MQEGISPLLCVVLSLSLSDLHVITHDLHGRTLNVCLFVCSYWGPVTGHWFIVCVSSGQLLLLSDSPHLGENVFGINCMQSSGIYAVALLFVCWG